MPELNLLRNRCLAAGLNSDLKWQASNQVQLSPIDPRARVTNECES